MNVFMNFWIPKIFLLSKLQRLFTSTVLIFSLISYVSQSSEFADDPFSEARRHYRGKADDFIRNVERANEYSVTEGYVEFFTLENCEELGTKYCFGNNPESPYGFIYVDPIEGQAVNDTDTESELRFRHDEAMIIFGLTPPSATYFGFTHYLYRRFKRGGKWDLISGSVDDSINPMNINVTSGDDTYESAFDAEMVIVYTADDRAFKDVENYFETIGIPSSCMNLGVFPLEDINMGVVAGSDTINFLMRIVNFHDKVLGGFYMEKPPLHVFRLTPRTEKSIESVEQYSTPERSNGTTGKNEHYLVPTLNKLQQNIMRMEGGFGIDLKRANSITVEATLYGENCIQNNKSCYRDNSDSTYFLNYPGRSLLMDDFFIIFGTNHVKTGFSRYISVSLYEGKTFTASNAFNSEDDLERSAWRYLPDDPNKDMMYAFSVRRDCTGKPFCMEVADLSKFTPAIVVRAYLSNSTVGPDPTELTGTRVIFGSSKMQYVKEVRSRRGRKKGSNDMVEGIYHKPET